MTRPITDDKIAAKLEPCIHIRYQIRCGECGNSDEFNDGDPLVAAYWFAEIGWRKGRGYARCPECSRKKKKSK